MTSENHLQCPGSRHQSPNSSGLCSCSSLSGILAGYYTSVLKGNSPASQGSKQLKKLGNRYALDSTTTHRSKTVIISGLISLIAVKMVSSLVQRKRVSDPISEVKQVWILIEVSRYLCQPYMAETTERESMNNIKAMSPDRRSQQSPS